MRDAHGREGFCPVDRSYDLFEMFPDGSAPWRGAVVGHEDAIRKLQELAAGTGNEMQLMHVPTKTVIATLNAPKV
jgi:hypothetical protein